MRTGDGGAIDERWDAGGIPKPDSAGFLGGGRRDQGKCRKQGGEVFHGNPLDSGRELGENGLLPGCGAAPRGGFPEMIVRMQGSRKTSRTKAC